MKTRRTPRPASELVANWFAGLAAAGAAPPVAPAAPAAPADAPEDPTDQAVDKAIAAIRADIQAAIDAQAKDDNAQPDDAKVLTGLQALLADLEKIETDQAADVNDDSDGVPGPATPSSPAPAPSGASAGTSPMAVPPGAPPAPAGPPPVATDPPASRPGSDPTSDVDNDQQCLDPQCNHLGSAHEDTDLGANTGPCTMANCACKGMRVPDQDPIGDDPAAGAPPAPAASTRGGQAMATLDGGQIADPTVVSPGVSGTPADSGNGTVDPSNGTDDGGPSLDAPTGPLNGPAFTIPVMIIEGIPTSDGRQVAEGALTWRTPPLPLMGLSETNDYGHDGAVIVGRIDSITREGNTISAKGFFDTSEDGLEFARLVETQMIKGVSADIADTTSEVIVTDVGTDGFPIGVNEQLTAGQIMGATICPFPAFEGAYIVLGDGTDGAAPIPMEKPTPEQAASGLHMLSAEVECVPCGEGVPIAASGGPLAPPREWFEDPQLTEPTRLRVDADGRVYGHFAIAGVCHVGIQGQCIEVPMGCDMGPFHQGYVVCADGSEVATGAITAGIGHASTSGRMSNAAVMAHYDNALYGVADVVAGEDEFGQWVAGALRPTATEEQVHMLRASSLSGDWRPQGRGYALYATLAVNRPGFPITKATKVNGRLTSVVAAGMIVDPPSSEESISVEDRIAHMEAAFSALAPDARANLRKQMEALRS